MTPTSGGYGQQTIQSERVLSSNVVNETVLGMPPEDQIQYVEVPVVEEVIRHVPKKEFVEIEKRVPRYEYEYIDRVVEIPQIHYVDKHVEMPQIQEIIRRVPVKQVVDVPKEYVRHVPKVEIKIVEREIEVPGEVIEVPKPYLVENRVVVPRYTDKEVATVVSQKLVPIISESESEFVDVDLREYNPYLVPVDVYVPRPVSRSLIATSKTEEHRVVDVPIGQFNALLRQMNGHINEGEMHDLLVKDQRGALPIMALGAGSFVVTPQSNAWESTHVKGALHFDINAPVGQISQSIMGLGTSGVTQVTTTTTPKLTNMPSSFAQTKITGTTGKSTMTTTTTTTTGAPMVSSSIRSSGVTQYGGMTTVGPRITTSAGGLQVGGGGMLGTSGLQISGSGMLSTTQRTSDMQNFGGCGVSKESKAVQQRLQAQLHQQQAQQQQAQQHQQFQQQQQLQSQQQQQQQLQQQVHQQQVHHQQAQQQQYNTQQVYRQQQQYTASANA